MRKVLTVSGMLLLGACATGTAPMKAQVTAACDSYYRGLETVTTYLQAGLLDEHDVAPIEDSLPYINTICLEEFKGNPEDILATLRVEFRRLLLVTSNVKGN